MIPRHLQIALVVVLAGIFGIASYMLRLKNKAAESAPRISQGFVAPPVSTPAEAVTFYIAYDDEGVLRPRPAMAALPLEPGARARELLRALLAQYLQKASPHSLGDGSDVKEVFIVNHSLAVIDLNSAFASGHRSGIWVEALTVDSLVATLAANIPGITKVKILVNGEERETLAGHADLISLYDVAEVMQEAQALR
jgi:Sporulation and spore germination